KANRFTLHCSLQTRTRRMFVHASEEGNPPNTCVLGLQMDNYIPDPAAVKSGSWAGVLVNAAKMQALFTEHVVLPLQQNAEDMLAPLPAEAEAGGAGALPTIALFVGGKMVFRVEGMMSEAQIQERVDYHLREAAQAQPQS
ncbi:hypothetical protein TSOC_014245, partial [Tetrabaena socialis]